LKITILDGETLGEVDFSPLKRFGEVETIEVFGQTFPEETFNRIVDSDIVITNKVVISRKMMLKASRLQLIYITATGMNNVDLESAREFGITVKNVAGYSTESVVQHTFATLFHLVEKLDFYGNFVKSGEWTKSKLFTNVSKPFMEISGKRFGIIGLGAIGRRVGEVAEAFGCEVVYYSTSNQNNSNRFQKLTLEELLKTSEIISVHAPLNEKTAGLLNSENMKLIKDGSVVLNMGRGGIIDEADLSEVIETRNILVGLDVISKEPIPKENPLYKVLQNENLFITPHIAWTSIEARERLLSAVISGIKDFISQNKF
jgi:glycerate dehydrogenase